MEVAGALRQRGEIGGLGGAQLGQGFVVICLGGRGDAVRVLPEEDLVEIELEDLVLAHRLLDPHGKDQFADFALGGARAVEKEVLHHLLGDGRGAAHILPARDHGLDKGRRHAADVIAGVGIEILVLGGNEGVFDDLGDFLDRREEAALDGKLVDDLAFAGIDPADRLGRVLRQRLIAR